MRGVAIDLVGQTFGRWIVTARAGSRGSGNKAAWACKCICGNVGVVVGEILRKGKSKSCGCLRREIAIALLAKHRTDRVPNLTLAHRNRRSGTKDAKGFTIVGPRHFRLSRKGPKGDRGGGGPAHPDVFSPGIRASWLAQFARDAREITRRHSQGGP